jgi:hypothetical protein
LRIAGEKKTEETTLFKASTYVQENTHIKGAEIYP